MAVAQSLQCYKVCRAIGFAAAGRRKVPAPPLMPKVMLGEERMPAPVGAGSPCCLDGLWDANGSGRCFEVR